MRLPFQRIRLVQRDPVKELAYRLVRLALKRGDLVRPEVCASCKTDPGKCVDGRHKIHAHHRDYSRPLDVEWICMSCHRKEERAESGYRPLHAKLDHDIAAEIRKSPLGYRRLAKIYGVNPGTIRDVKKGLLWRST